VPGRMEQVEAEALGAAAGKSFITKIYQNSERRRAIIPLTLF